MADRKKTETVTPKGTTVYPKLNEPDTKYNPKGSYETKLTFDDANAGPVQDFVALAEKVRDEFFDELVARLTAEKKGAAAKQLKKVDVLKAELDKETGEETGKVFIKAKMNATGERKDGTKWSQKPIYFDARGKQLKNPPRIGGGSVVKLGVVIDPYVMESSKEVGVTLRLKAVQIISLVTGGQRSFESYGFEAEDGDEIEDCEFDAGQVSDETSGSTEDDDL